MNDEDFFKDVNRECAEIVKTMQRLFPWIVEGSGTDFESVSMHDKELFCARFKHELGFSVRCQEARNKKDWGKE